MKKTKLMGILNVTPDSFFDQGEYFSIDKAVERGIEIYLQGADIIDIGGESTRPNAKPVSLEDELKRVIPVITQLKKVIPIPISIDTMKVEVARQSIDAGADFINDITGFSDPQMIELAVKTKSQIIVMHMQGTPATMQNKPNYEKGIIEELFQFFDSRIAILIASGVKKEQIILDPGIGFGKSIADNLEIIHNLPEVKRIGLPVLLGISRKSFMSKLVDKPAESLLSPTLGLNTVAIMSHIDMIRVHDVKEHRMLIDIMNKYLEKQNKPWISSGY